MSSQVSRLVRSFHGCEAGVTVTEYAVMLGLIVVVAVAAISGIGQTMAGTYAILDGGLQAAVQ